MLKYFFGKREPEPESLPPEPEPKPKSEPEPYTGPRVYYRPPGFPIKKTDEKKVIAAQRRLREKYTVEVLEHENH